MTSQTPGQLDDTRSVHSALREERIKLQIKAVNKKYAGYNYYGFSDLYFSSETDVMQLHRFIYPQNCQTDDVGKDGITVGEMWAIKEAVTCFTAALGRINSHILSHRTLCLLA